MKGFSLVEFVVVAAIIVLLLSISIAAFRNYQPSLELSSAVRDLVSDLRYVQQQALTEQIEHGVRFATTTNSYKIIKYGATETTLQEKILPEGVSFFTITGLDQNQAIFNPYGAIKTAGAVTFINTQSATTTLDIRPSGFVRVIK